MKTFKQFLDEATKKKPEEPLTPYEKAMDHVETKNYRWALHHLKKHEPGRDKRTDAHAQKLAYNLHIRLNHKKMKTDK